MSVCTTAINAGGLRTTHHLPRKDKLINPALKANSIPLDLTHISHHCHFFQWLSPRQVETTDNFAFTFGYILWLRCTCIKIISHQPRKFHVSSQLLKYSLTFIPTLSETDTSCEPQWWSSKGTGKGGGGDFIQNIFCTQNLYSVLIKFINGWQILRYSNTTGTSIKWISGHFISMVTCKEFIQSKY